jgi:hypothetical protein
LALSEYVSADSDHSTVVWQARLQLIEAVKRVYPRFLEKLSTDVFPFYRQLADRKYDFDRLLWRDSPYKRLPEDGGLKSALSRWAAEFNAETDWLLAEALRTLRGWYVAADWRKSLKWNTFHGRSDRFVVGDPFEFRCAGWEMQLLTWSHYSESVRGQFETALAEYEKRVRELAASRGLVRAQRKYSPENLEWFVLYQFAGMSSTAIVNRLAQKDVGQDESTVLKGIKAAAKLVGWDHLRDSRRKHTWKIS